MTPITKLWLALGVAVVAAALLALWFFLSNIAPGPTLPAMPSGEEATSTLPVVFPAPPVLPAPRVAPQAAFSGGEATSTLPVVFPAPPVLPAPPAASGTTTATSSVTVPPSYPPPPPL